MPWSQIVLPMRETPSDMIETHYNMYTSLFYNHSIILHSSVKQDKPNNCQRPKSNPPKTTHTMTWLSLSLSLSHTSMLMHYILFDLQLRLRHARQTVRGVSVCNSASNHDLLSQMTRQKRRGGGRLPDINDYSTVLRPQGARKHRTLT